MAPVDRPVRALKSLRQVVAAIAVVSAIVPTAARAQPVAASVPVLACVPPERLACGCFIRLDGVTCRNRSFDRQPHLFTALEPSAPLWLHLNGSEVALPQTGHVGASVKGDPPGRSQDTYRADGIEVRIDYMPAASTCPASKADGCEYTDLSARVAIKLRGRIARTYRGTATCGC